jgi:uncharacterized repeat protein (TIGR01451 family)
MHCGPAASLDCRKHLDLDETDRTNNKQTEEDHQGGSKMEKSKRITPVRILAALFTLAALTLACAAPAFASTSGGATIHNLVTVSYMAGTQPYSTTSYVNVTVVTLGSTPAVIPPTGKTFGALAFGSYSTTIASTANGIDNYAIAYTTPPAGASVTAAPVVTNGVATVTLWGGITTGSVAGTSIKLPAGAAAQGTGLQTGQTVTLLIGGVPSYFTVGTISPGTLPTPTQGPSSESYDTVNLTLISGSALTGTLTGVQVGQYVKIPLVTYQVGSPLTTTTDGTYSWSYTVTPGTTDAASNPVAAYTSPTITTTVLHPTLTITKYSRNATTGAGTFAISGTIAKPTQVIEYQIVVSNTGSGSAQNVYIQDAIPSYITLKQTGSLYGTGDVSITGVHPSTPLFGDEGDAAYAPALTNTTVNFTLGTGSGDAKTLIGGVIPPGQTVTILYQATVN